MIKININDRKTLIRLLESLYLLQTYRGRKQLLEYSGLSFISPHIDLEGPSFVFISDLLNYLEVYGRVTYDHEALGMFLNSVKEFLGESEENQRFIDKILSNYNLMIPIKQTPEPDHWISGTDTDSINEKIIGENTLRNISFLKRGFDVSGSVALIDAAKKWTGTGFMISSDLLMTNHHVIPDESFIGEILFRFNYQLTFDGIEEIVSEYKAKKGGIFYSNEELDFTIIELENPAGEDWGVSTFGLYQIPIESRVNIIQHPAGLPKQISFQNNLVVYSDSKIVQYVTSTLCGSSGSPVYNDQWKVVAIHHAGGYLLEPGSNKMFYRNEGISVISILNNVPSIIRKRINPNL